MLTIFENIEKRDYNERGGVTVMFDSIPPFQFQSGAPIVGIGLEDSEGNTQYLVLDVDREDDYNFYLGGEIIPLGIYSLVIDTGFHTFYSEHFEVIDCVPKKRDVYRDKLHLPLRFFDTLQPKEVYQYMGGELAPFQLVSKMAMALEEPQVWLCDAQQGVLLDLEVEVKKLDDKIYYIVDDEGVAIPEGEYYLRVDDSLGNYYSNWFGVGCEGTKIEFANPCDIGGIFFADGFKSHVILTDINIGEVDVDTFEEGYNDQQMIFKATDRKTTIRRILSTKVLPEHLADFLRRLRYFNETYVTHNNKREKIKVIEVATEPFASGYLVRVQYEEKGVVSTVCDCDINYFTIFCGYRWLGDPTDGLAGSIRLLDDGLEPNVLGIINVSTGAQSGSFTFSQLSDPVVLDFSQLVARVDGEIVSNNDIEWSLEPTFINVYDTLQTFPIDRGAMVFVRVKPRFDKEFVSEWVIPSNGFSFRFPIIGNENDYYINWGDGTPEEHYTTNLPQHIYSQAGNYFISIRGSVEQIYSEIRDYFPSIQRGLCKKIVNWGDIELQYVDHAFTWWGLESLPSGEITGMDNITSFEMTFYDNKLTNIPKKLFNKTVLVVNFSYVFSSNEIEEIPSGLFDYNPLAADFAYTFERNELTSIPDGLFDNNPLASDFQFCFANNLLQSVPVGLFDNNINAEMFMGAFFKNYQLTLNPYIFSSTGDYDRFKNQTVNFHSCFIRTDVFTGIKGTAPDLWNYNGSKQGSLCFTGHNTDTLTNFGDIPAGWK